MASGDISQAEYRVHWYQAKREVCTRWTMTWDWVQIKRGLKREADQKSSGFHTNMKVIINKKRKGKDGKWLFNLNVTDHARPFPNYFHFVGYRAQVIIWEKFSILLVDRFSCFPFLLRQLALRGVPSYRSWSTGICENFHQDLFHSWDFLRITIEDVKLHHNFFNVWEMTQKLPQQDMIITT